ncbi:MAG: ABC transporter substrate-binding protein [Pseudomonadota bacterium]
MHTMIAPHARMEARIEARVRTGPTGAWRLLCGAVIAPLMVLAMLFATPASALDSDGAKAHVRTTVDEVLDLVRGSGSGDSKANDFRAILEQRAAMPQIARFAAGAVWRDMSDAQQRAYVDAFSHYLATIYARRFQEYSGQSIDLGTTRDLGRRGIEVESTVKGGGQPPIAVAWVVSDRPGRVVLADIVIEGVSLLITQRDEITALVSQKGGIDGLIEFLAGT